MNESVFRALNPLFPKYNACMSINCGLIYHDHLFCTLVNIMYYITSTFCEWKEIWFSLHYIHSILALLPLCHFILWFWDVPEKKEKKILQNEACIWYVEFKNLFEILKASVLFVIEINLAFWTQYYADGVLFDLGICKLIDYITVHCKIYVSNNWKEKYPQAKFSFQCTGPEYIILLCHFCDFASWFLVKGAKSFYCLWFVSTF